MSAGQIHLTRLQAHLESEYDWLKTAIHRLEPNVSEASVRTRLLLGFALERMAECPRDLILDHIVDGSRDRGIDAFYFDRLNLKAYIIQSKYVDQPGSSPISEADAKSFATGANEIFALSILDHGNSRIQDLRDEIVEAVSTPGVELFPILVSTSDKDIADSVNVIFRNSFESSMGDPDALKYSRLSDLYQIISPYGEGGGANLSITLNGYNMVSVPFSGYYGWVTGTTLAELYEELGERLFSKNLRTGLGGTEINDDIAQTALNKPENFWYFNNGVTFISDGVSRTLRGGAGADNVALTVSNGSIVNGAQTTSTLGELLGAEGGRDALSRLKCLVRVLEIPSEEVEFSTSVTRFNNSQNGIGVKDFVSLDPFQQELRRGLDREFAISYVIRSGEDYGDSNIPTISLQEATVALVSCGTSVDNAVRAKDKISALWRDTSSDPYLSIFDQSRLTPLALYKAVEANRLIEKFLMDRMAGYDERSDQGLVDRERAVATHGNRLFSFYVLTGANIWREEQPVTRFIAKLKIVDLSGPFENFVKTVFDRYGSSYKAPLFKNRTKCADIFSVLPGIDLGIS